MTATDTPTVYTVTPAVNINNRIQLNAIPTTIEYPCTQTNNKSDVIDKLNIVQSSFAYSLTLFGRIRSLSKCGLDF